MVAIVEYLAHTLTIMVSLSCLISKTSQLNDGRRDIQHNDTQHKGLICDTHYT
jgi:hypothetical protein